MIHRKFDNLKFKRSYVGGSKQREREIFIDVQGTKEDNSECDWLEYRRVFTQYSDDVLNIVLSWKQLMTVLRTVFISLAIIVFFVSPSISLLLLSVGLVSQLGLHFFEHKEKKRLSAYDFSLNIILSSIKKETGFNFNKN